MRVLIQRVREASVTVDGTVTGAIEKGLLVFVGITQTDTEQELQWMCEKILNLRIFSDSEGKMNHSVLDVAGGILVVSQFTLYGNAQKGNRPSYIDAAPPAIAQPLYNAMLDYFRSKSPLVIQSGIFGAMMDVRLLNDGPVTIWLEREAG
jgi:D-tyrosyl-tRNA(Tyr) deacylase